MPSSGELRLRTLILALTALGGIWIALVIQRSHHVPAAAFASGPQPADFPAPKQLWTIDDLGGWSKVNDELFDPDKGSVAKIYNEATG